MSDTMKLQCELDHKTQEVAKLQQELDKQKLATKCQQSAAKGWQAKAIAQSAEMARQRQILMEMNENQSIDLEKLQAELASLKEIHEDALQSNRVRTKTINDQSAEITRLNKELNEALNRDPFF
jgi:hypothetical protein